MTQKDTEYWRQKAENSDLHEWCAACEKSYFESFGSCPHESHPEITDSDEIRADEILDGKLMIHIDDPDGDHPLDKKAWIWGYPVEVDQ